MTDILQNVVDAHKHGGTVAIPNAHIVTVDYEGKLYSKGRPRFTGTHTYTPPNTVKFEASAADCYRKAGVTPVKFPVSVVITLFEPVAENAEPWRRAMRKANVIFNTVGDVDNKAKSILDAGNGLLFADDGQVSSLKVARVTRPSEGFRISLYRSGYTLPELGPTLAHMLQTGLIT